MRIYLRRSKTFQSKLISKVNAEKTGKIILDSLKEGEADYTLQYDIILNQKQLTNKLLFNDEDEEKEIDYHALLLQNRNLIESIREKNKAWLFLKNIFKEKNV